MITQMVGGPLDGLYREVSGKLDEVAAVVKLPAFEGLDFPFNAKVSTQSAFSPSDVRWTEPEQALAVYTRRAQPEEAKIQGHTHLKYDFSHLERTTL
jgi:hypothetical protein